MAISKNTEKGKCPFILHDPCNPECAFFRKGIRYSELPGQDPIPFEECAINIIADNLEAMHNRTYMMQQEVGDTKNIMALKTMVDMGINVKDANENLVRMIMKIVNPDRRKQLNAEVDEKDIKKITDK